VNLLAVPFLIALVVSLLFGGKVIAALAAAKARQPVSEDAPEAHKIKHGTPTMGGLLILIATLTAVVVCALTPVLRAAPLLNMATEGRVRGVFAVAGVFLLACLVGLADDTGKARKKLNKAGLSERAKLGLQFLVAGLFVAYLGLTEQQGLTTALMIGRRVVDLGIWYYGLGILYLCFFGNAVNFTDGLDGLSSGVTLIVSLTLALTVSALHPEVSVFYLAVAGACAGFLWFNAHPAKVFMGDTGSLALGMGLAAAAMAAKQELLLLIVGFVYVAEIASMMIQRYVFKYRRIRHGIEYAKANRVFRRAPLHHHFEELGWPETRVVVRFYVAALAFAALGFLLAPYLVPATAAGNGVIR